MTEKKHKILEAALVLFAKDGYKSTSTSKVAKLAGVSEGLIFRHYTNKEGLLNAIMMEGEERAKVLFADIVMESDPKEVIRKTLEIGLQMMDDEGTLSFWKLQYKVKWETEQYGAKKLEPLKIALERAFTELEYADPHNEAMNMLMVMDGISTRYLLDRTFKVVEFISFLKKKYKI